MLDDLAQAGLLPRGDSPDRLDHRAFPLLAHPGQQQPKGLGRHGPPLGEVVAERERVEQARRRAAQRQHPRLAAAGTKQRHERLRVSLRVDHGYGHAAQGQLQDQQQGQSGLAAARLAGDRHRGRAVPGGGDQRVEVHDGPGAPQRLADVGADPAGVRSDAVAQVDGRGRHPACDRVQRLALQVGAEPDPVPGHGLAEQRELVPGGVHHVDPGVPVVLGHRLGPPHAQLARGRAHHQPVPAVDERQPLLGDAVLEQPGRLDLLGERDRQLGPGLSDVRVHVPGVRKPAADVLAGLGRRYQPHPQAGLDRERQRVAVVQPGLALGEVHDVGEPGEGQERRVRLPGRMLQPQQRTPVVHLAFEQRLDLPRAPPAAPRRRRRWLADGAGQRVPEQPGDVIGSGMAGGEGAGAQRAAQPLGLLGPPRDLARRHGLVGEAQGFLAGPVGADELGEHPSRQLGAHAALAQPDAEVDLLRPEILGPHVLVHLVQVLRPARAAVGGGVQAGRPLGGRIGPVRDPQVHLGVRHPDGGQGHGDVGRQRLPFLWRGEFVRHRGQPVVGPRVSLGEQDPVVEVPDLQPAPARRLRAAHALSPARLRGALGHRLPSSLVPRFSVQAAPRPSSSLMGGPAAAARAPRPGRR